MDDDISQYFKKSEPELVEKFYKGMNKGAGGDELVTNRMVNGVGYRKLALNQES